VYSERYFVMGNRIVGEYRKESGNT